MARSQLRHQLGRVRGAARRRIKERLAAVNGLPAGWQNATVAEIADGDLWPLREAYEGRFEPTAPISYATARDYVDSFETMPGLATVIDDMKSVQRCWIVKAVLGTVPRGSRLVEIGAGEPIVAGLLSRLGYDVTVIDPYEGTGNGPREYRQFRATYPDLHIVRDEFPPSQPLDTPCDAVYTISVLEHVPPGYAGGLVEAAHDIVRPGGWAFHAVDTVVAGWGADHHRTVLEEVIAAAGLDREQLAATLREMADDPETYFVSVEAYNDWRGATPYDTYPMRRIGSVNLFARPGA